MEYKVLAILDFDNVRKRMSVIVQDPNGKRYRPFNAVRLFFLRRSVEQVKHWNAIMHHKCIVLR